MSMHKKQRRNKPVSWRARLIAAAVIAVCVLVFLLARFAGVRKEKAQVDKGVKYLAKIDSEEALKKSENKIKQQRQDAISKLLDKESSGDGEGFDPWGYFNDSVIMGDSRAVGFYLFDYLPQSRVIAAAGNTIQTIEDSIDTLNSINPSYVFLCYGLNDVTSGRWTSADEWIKEYAANLDKLQSMFPKTVFCVNSILPVTDAALATSDRVKLVPEYANALRKYCEENNITYVDCDNLPKNHPDEYEADGIHFKKTFYPYWAAEMIVTAYVGDDDDVSSGSAEDGSEN